MPTVHVHKCGECGEPYSWPLHSTKIWTTELEGRKRYLSECPYCGCASALRWVQLEAEHPLERLMEILQRVVAGHASAANRIAGSEADAEIRTDDEPTTPPSGTARQWTR